MSDYGYKKGREVDDFTEYHGGFPASIAEEIISHLHKMNPGILGQDKPYFDSMIDAGCGSGIITKLFVSYFRSIIAFDISDAQIEKAKELNPADNIKYVVGPGEVMPADDNSVDFILSTCSAQYFDMKAFSRECKRVLKANGCATIYCDELLYLHHFDSNGGPVSNKTGIDLFLSYYEGLHQYLSNQNHPDKKAFTRFSCVYDSIEGLNKERNDDLTFESSISLSLFKRILLSIPSFFQYHQTFKDEKQTDPLDIFGQKLKERWNVSHLSDEDVHLTLTISVFLICLTKNKQEGGN